MQNECIRPWFHLLFALKWIEGVVISFPHSAIFLIKYSWSIFECRSFSIVWTMWLRIVLGLGKNLLFVRSVTLESPNISLFMYPVRCFLISGTFLTPSFTRLSIFFTRRLSVVWLMFDSMLDVLQGSGYASGLVFGVLTLLDYCEFK